MKIQRFEVPGLAQFSYIVSDGDEAIVVDPIRDTDRYLAYAEAHGLRITHVLETHIHADFAAGSVALSRSTGAELALSAHDDGQLYRYRMAHRALRDGDSLRVGGARIQALHTPGHTPEHLSFVLFDTAQSGAVPVALLTGDLLFAGSAGRPDLLGDEAKIGLAQELYRSLQQRLAHLPDGVAVYPGHGAGSLCGSGMSDRVETTLGYERTTNPFFRYTGDEFVAEILASAPPMPSYYPRMKRLNAEGALPFNELPAPRALAADEVEAFRKAGQVTLLDLRTPEAFGGAHIPGSLSIGSKGNLSLWAGWLIAPERSIVLIADESEEDEARLTLARVGLDRVLGCLEGGMARWIAGGRPFSRTTQKTVGEVEQERSTALVLDVRTDEERRGGAIPGSRHVSLGELEASVNLIPRSGSIITVCGSGYRSSAAASVLEQAGFAEVSTLAGGMGAWRRQEMPLAAE